VHRGAAGGELGERLALHAGDVGDECAGMPLELRRHHVSGPVRRHGHDDQGRCITVGAPAAGAVVHGEGERRRRCVVEDDVDAESAEAEPDARAEQAGSDDADLPRSTGGHGRQC
jgi:hypothetical protein